MHPSFSARYIMIDTMCFSSRMVDANWAGSAFIGTSGCIGMVLLTPSFLKLDLRDSQVL